MIQFPVIPTTAVIVAGLIVTTTDLWKYKVYNALTFPFLMSGLIYHACFDSEIGPLGSLAGALTGFGIMIVFYIMGGMGAGDVKLMAGAGAWLGIRQTFCVFIASSLASGIYAIVLVLLTGTIFETWINIQIMWNRSTSVGRGVRENVRVESEVRHTDRRRRVIPFAAMITLGAFAAWIWDAQ